MVPTNDEVRRTVVLADNGVPHGLAGAAHAHGEGQEAERGHAVGVPREECLVNAHAREVVDVTGLREAHNGMDQDVGLLGACSTDGQLAVSAVHGVAGLERDDALPAELVEVGAELGGSVWWRPLC